MSEVTTPNFTFLSVNQFKADMGIKDQFKVAQVKEGSPKFIISPNGASYRCSGDFDHTKPMQVLIVDGDLSNPCFINEKPIITLGTF